MKNKLFSKQEALPIFQWIKYSQWLRYRTSVFVSVSVEAQPYKKVCVK